MVGGGAACPCGCVAFWLQVTKTRLTLSAKGDYHGTQGAWCWGMCVLFWVVGACAPSPDSEQCAPCGHPHPSVTPMLETSPCGVALPGPPLRHV